MSRMKKIMTVIAISACIVLLACGNKEKQTKPIVVDGLPTAEESQIDTVAASVQIESSKEEENPSKRVTTSASSLNTSKSTKYDNMRGFDPASEDDKRITGRFFDPLKMADVIIMNGIKTL